MPRKSDNTVEIIKKMGYSPYHVKKLKSIKKKKEKEKVFMNLIFKYSQFHNMKCDLKINCKRIQRGGSKTTDKAFNGILSIISNLQKSNLNSLASIKLHQNQQDLSNKRDSAKDIEIADYKKKIEKLSKEIERYNINSDELKRLHSLAKNKIENEMEQSKNLSKEKYSNLLEKHENALGTYQNKLSQLTNSKQKQESLTQLKISELKKFKHDTYQINLMIFLTSFQGFYQIFSILKNKFIICKLIKNYLLKRKDVIKDLKYKTVKKFKKETFTSGTYTRSPILNYTQWYERLDIFNENLIPMKEYQKIVDKCCFILYDLIEKYGIDINDSDYQFVKVDNKFKGYHEIATDLIRYKSNDGTIIEAKFEEKRVQGIQPNDTTLDSFSSIIDNISLLNVTIDEIEKQDLDFLNLVIVNTLQVVECGCLSPCNYTWEQHKHKQIQPWCIMSPNCKSNNKDETNYPGESKKDCAPIDNPRSKGRGKNTAPPEGSGYEVYDDYYLEVIKGVSRKGGEPIYYIGNSKIPYAAPTKKAFCFKKLEKGQEIINDKMSPVKNCNNNQKQTIRAFLEEKLVNTIQNLSKIKKSFLTVFDSANKTTVKHNPKELRKREPKELQKREPKKLKKSKSKGKGSGWSSDFEKRNIKS